MFKSVELQGIHTWPLRKRIEKIRMFLLSFSIILDYLWLFIENIFVFIIPSTNIH